jgi:hypothetical protein
VSQNTDNVGGGGCNRVLLGFGYLTSMAGEIRWLGCQFLFNLFWMDVNGLCIIHSQANPSFVENIILPCPCSSLIFMGYAFTYVTVTHHTTKSVEYMKYYHMLINGKHIFTQPDYQLHHICISHPTMVSIYIVSQEKNQTILSCYTNIQQIGSNIWNC